VRYQGSFGSAAVVAAAFGAADDCAVTGSVGTADGVALTGSTAFAGGGGTGAAVLDGVDTDGGGTAEMDWLAPGGVS
jgi:hypothetical protein